MRPGVPADTAAAGLLSAIALGAALGILYDLLRPLRRRAGRASSLADLLFALLAGIGAFCCAMSAESGRLRIWELAASLMGFLLWQNFLSRFKRACVGFFSKNHTKKVQTEDEISSKKDFQKLIK